jgi:hypothetical protein
VKIYGVFENMTIRDETGDLRIYNTAAGAETAARPAQRPCRRHADRPRGQSKDRLRDGSHVSPRGAAIPRAPETIAVGNTLKEFDVDDADIIFAGGQAARSSGPKSPPRLRRIRVWRAARS